MKLDELRRFDAAELILDDQDVVYFLESSLEDGSTEDLARALETVIRAKGNMILAEQVGLSRNALDDILNPAGEFKREQLLKIYAALGVQPTNNVNAAE